MIVLMEYSIEKKNSYQTYPKMTIKNEINSMKEEEDDCDNKINIHEITLIKIIKIK